MTTKTTPKEETRPQPPKTPNPEDAPQGVPLEDDRAARMAPGPDEVKVSKGTVTI